MVWAGLPSRAGCPTSFLLGAFPVLPNLGLLNEPRKQGYLPSASNTCKCSGSYMPPTLHILHTALGSVCLESSFRSLPTQPPVVKIQDRPGGSETKGYRAWAGPSLTSCPAAILGHPWSIGSNMGAQRSVCGSHPGLGVPCLSRTGQAGLELCVGLAEQRTAASHKYDVTGPRSCCKLGQEAWSALLGSI